VQNSPLQQGLLMFFEGFAHGTLLATVGAEVVDGGHG
jgi:hypothetical protein